jgi:phosphoglycolate phosphatase
MINNSIKYVFFDLDGTLTDPFEGITNSVAYSLNSYGISVSDRKELACFIGPPLYESFEKYYGFSKEKAIKAVEKYREYFSVTGLFENEVYLGAENLLKELNEKGLKVILATSKPEVFAKRILDHFGLSGYFVEIVGSLLSGERVKKGDVINEALNRLDNPSKESVVMVGDRSHDIIGAKENGIISIGVLYGYGNREELTESGADYIAENIEKIKEILL